MKSISIVMTSYKRAHLLKNTLDSIVHQTRRPNQIVVVEDGYDQATADVCAVAQIRQGLPVIYFERRNRPKLTYSNPAIPKNIGIKQASGEILIIQCAEVKYTDRNDIANLVKPLEEQRGISNVATVTARDEHGGFQEWYAGPQRRSLSGQSCEKWFLDFCQAVYKEDVVAIGGFDESYRGYGFDDDDFAYRLQASGVRYRWAMEVECHHQWHKIIDKDVELSEFGRAMYNRMVEDIKAGKRTPVVNGGPNGGWGDLNS